MLLFARSGRHKPHFIQLRERSCHCFTLGFSFMYVGSPAALQIGHKDVKHGSDCVRMSQVQRFRLGRAFNLYHQPLVSAPAQVHPKSVQVNTSRYTTVLYTRWVSETPGSDEHYSLKSLANRPPSFPSSTNLDSDSLSSPVRLSVSLSDCEDQLDRLQQVELARSVPMSRWRAGTLQAWLEVIMAMPMYIRACTDNVKSGKVMLALTDADLETGLGISSSMHRRKLRLAIEDYRQAEAGHGLSKAAELDHHWVAQAWLNDVGLPQYSQYFHTHLVDGRLLGTLTRADLEKHLHVTKKAHQNSLLLGTQLLHMLDFSKEVLRVRRADCEGQNTDPLVWSCQRIIKWLRDIDLKEFADSLQNSGVHGAVMVLDPSFNTDSMATALGIPGNKHMVRQHLNEEMKALLSTARQGVEQEIEPLGTPPPLSRPSSLGRSTVSRHGDQLSHKKLSVKPPVSFSLREHGEQDMASLSSGTLGRDGCEEALPQADSGPMRTLQPDASKQKAPWH